jgi:TonB-dependent starch-binding outer membrane protein SusC
MMRYATGDVGQQRVASDRSVPRGRWLGRAVCCLGWVLGLVTSVARAQPPPADGDGPRGMLDGVYVRPAVHATVAGFGGTGVDGRIMVAGEAVTDAAMEVVAEGLPGQRGRVSDGASVTRLLVTIEHGLGALRDAVSLARIAEVAFALTSGSRERRGDPTPAGQPVAGERRGGPSGLDPGADDTRPGAEASSRGSRDPAPGGGRPGDPLVLDGVSGISDASTPLYVIDGVIVSPIAEPLGLDAMFRNRSLRRLVDPRDIASAYVLRGAAATALYGAAATNGVVVIATRRGHGGAHRATLTQRLGISQPSRRLGSRVFTLDEVREMFCHPDYTAEECDSHDMVKAYKEANGKTYDHEAELLRTAISTETIGTLSGGIAELAYEGSVRYRDAPGILIGTADETVSGRLAASYQFGARVRVGLSASVSRAQLERGISTIAVDDVPIYARALATPSFRPQRHWDGYTGRATGVVSDSAESLEGVLATIAIDAYSGADGASTVKLLGSYTEYRFRQDEQTVTSKDGLFEPDDGQLGARLTRSWEVERRSFGAGVLWTLAPQSRRIYSTLSAGVSYKTGDASSQVVIRRGVEDPDHAFLRTETSPMAKADTGVYMQGETVALDGRLSVVAGVVAERTKLNRLETDYHLFPKLALAWSLIGTDADVREDPGVFRTLRIRAARGSEGRVAEASPTLEDLSMIRQHRLEFGLDLVMRHQRWAAEITAYDQEIKSRRRHAPLSMSNEFIASTMFSDVGVRSRGIEATIEVRPISTAWFEWVSRASLKLARSLTILPAAIPAYTLGGRFGFGWGDLRIEDGKSPTQIVASVDRSGRLEVVGDATPELRVSWANRWIIGGLAVGVQLDWQHGGDVVNRVRANTDGDATSPDVEAASERIAAVAGGDPRPYIEDASFVKLREVSISYDLPRRYATRLAPLKTLQLSVSGRDLATFTSYSGLDPEVANSAPGSVVYDMATYHPSRSYWFSITAGI